jgi:hypothetical protein
MWCPSRCLRGLPIRTIGVWVSAFFTLAILSYIYRDNVFYKLTEAIIVGVSAGYLMVVGFWDSIVADLMFNLAPEWTQSWALPGANPDRPADWWYAVPLVLGLMLFLRFVPRLEWLAQWPLAFVVGTFAGLRLILFLEADFVAQIKTSIAPLLVFGVTETGSTINVGATLGRIGTLISLLACLSYFVFTVPHQGWLGRSARLGVWVLMITFGAAFAFTVMGRITLLTMRLEFLFRDWLHIL